MDLRQLEMLLAVVECGGYAHAGQRLNISHSAIHRQIRLLEQEVHDRVLVRAGKHMELTETGRILTGLGGRIRLDLANTLIRIRDLSQLQYGHLRLGTGTTMLVFYLPRVLERFRREFPKVTVHVMTGTADQVLTEIGAGNLDLGIVYSPAESPRSGREIAHELLYKDEFVLAVGSGHPLARRHVVSADDLRDVPFITYSKSSHLRRLIERRFQEAGLSPRIIMELENEEAIEKMIGLNVGFSVLSKRRVLRDHIPHLRIRNLPLICEACLVYPKLSYLSRTVTEFTRLCREESRALQQ